MKIFNLAFRRETAVPVLAISFASGICLTLLLARIAWTGNFRYAFLGWNLFLAWLPLVFALLACDEDRARSTNRWRFRGLTLAWLLFFPNAPYIFTDLTHLNHRFAPHFWTDLVLILTCALTGLVVGFVSLYLMHGAISRIMGKLAGWSFVGAVTLLSGFGICLGRFLRFNSWDVLFKPMKLYQGIGAWAVNPIEYPGTYALPILFGTFLFLAYLMLYALTHLQPAPALAPAQTANP